MNTTDSSNIPDDVAVPEGGWPAGPTGDVQPTTDPQPAEPVDPDAVPQPVTDAEQQTPDDEPAEEYIAPQVGEQGNGELVPAPPAPEHIDPPVEAEDGDAETEA